MDYRINLYICSPDNRYRFALGMERDRNLIVFGVNPSTADATTPDQTIRRVMGFAEKFGCTGFIMLNLSAQRATNPQDMHPTRSEPEHRENLRHIQSILQRSPDAVLLAAWGRLIRTRRYLMDNLKDINALMTPTSPPWHTLGPLLKSGHPRHPSRARASLSLNPFNMADYGGWQR